MKLAFKKPKKITWKCRSISSKSELALTGKSSVYITVFATHFSHTLKICLCQIFPFLLLLHIYSLSLILFILLCYCLHVHSRMSLGISLRCSLFFVHVGFHLTVLFQHLCISFWWNQLLVTEVRCQVVISQSPVYVRDTQLLILLSILRAEALSASCPIRESHDIISMVFWNDAQWSCLFPLRLY